MTGRFAKLSLVVFSGAIVLGACASTTSTAPGQAAQDPGSTRTVCARVADAIEDPVSDGPLHLYLEKPAPDQSLIVTIRNRNTAGNLRYLARVICVTGQVEQSPEGARIVVDRAAQVSVSGDPIPRFDVSEAASHLGEAVRLCGPIHSFEWTPGSDLEASLVLGSGDPQSSVWVTITDRRGLDIRPGGPAVNACVTGFVRSGEGARPQILVRDLRELTIEG
jgi:hypothetical protein